MAIIQNLEAFVQSYPAGLDSVTDLQLSQNENGRQIRFTIGGVTIPAGSVATISGTKPDGVVYSNTGTIEGADTVIFDEDVQMTAVFGTWYAKIRITNAGNTIASARVRFIIDKDPVDAGAIPSESQLDGLVAEAEEYAEAAEDAAERAAITYGSPLTAATASAMTDINRVYVYTGSESGYTYGNWYYYNGSAWVSGGVYNSAAVETDTTLTESGVPADAKATGDKIAELKDDLGLLTDTEIVANFTKTMTGTAATQWQTNVPVTVTDDMYICLYAVKNVTTANRKMWFRTIYTDSTIMDTQVVSVDQWYKINCDSSKTFQSVNIMFTRSDATLESSTESEFNYVIVKGAPIEYFKNSVDLYHYFAVGTIVGLINIDTVNKKISIPAGHFYQTGDIYGRDITATEIDASALPVMSVICIDWSNRTYVVFGYSDYRTKKADEYTAILTYRKDSKYFASPYQVSFDGSTYVASDTTLSLANSAADAKTVGFLHNFAVGHILGKINFDTVSQKITIPAGHFYHTGQPYGRDIPAAELDYSSAYVMNVVCIDWNNLTYVTLPYSTYRAQPSTQYEAIATYRKATPEDVSSPYQVTINGYTPVTLNETGVPYYWVSELENKIDEVALLQTYSEGISFGFITDIHWETNFQKSPALLEYIAKHSRLDMWINGGDSATGDQGDGTLQIKRLYECIGSYNRNFKFYSIIGNHDDNSIPAGHTTLNGDTLKSLVMPDYDALTFGNGNYYWFDYRGTRFVCLDTKNIGASDTVQTTWAANVIQNSTLPVIVAMHIIKGSYSDANPCTFFNDLITAIGANTDGKVKLIIGGHTHHDYSFIASNGIPVIALDTDSRFADDDITRVNGTISEQCFSAVTVDYTNKVINVTRFGTIGNSFTVTY